LQRAIQNSDKNKGCQAKKEFSYLKARMEHRESLTNIATKTDEEVNELKKTYTAGGAPQSGG